jgi:hypothetical protein
MAEVGTSAPSEERKAVVPADRKLSRSGHSEVRETCRGLLGWLCENSIFGDLDIYPGDRRAAVHSVNYDEPLY